MSYCDVDLVRGITGLGSGEIRDRRIRELRDEVAVTRLNDDIQTRVDSERVRRISKDKLNKVDGANDVFYLRKVHNSFRQLGDLNDDGEIDENDIKIWAADSSRDLKVTEVLDADKGRFKAVEIVDGEEEFIDDADVYVRYRHSPVDMSSPNNMVSVACAQLTGAFAFSNIETSKLKNFSIGDVTIRKQSQGFSLMMDQYKDSMRSIVNRELSQFGENRNTIEDVISKNTTNDQPLGSGKNTSGRFRSG